MVSDLDSIYLVPPCSISSPKVNLFQHVCWSSSHCHPILGTGSRKDYACKSQVTPLFTSYWPKFSQVAIFNYKGGWEM